ncbi:hypothetical protein [Phaeocystidibacter luteus]|uniref:Uncharacterized protein n=1 Tax=Phaeocystidibacter luteus TaxID=911197 RepID=A0A6N6RF01_9FLAO|nr:hypothetical protein [Phaeocystidibacter luteus]KAB2804304.1 hypothetical protein F8C67_14175 [Phaeocystidibacter luteus]
MTNRILFIILFVVVGLFGAVVFIQAIKSPQQGGSGGRNWSSTSYPSKNLPAEVMLWRDTPELKWSHFKGERSWGAQEDDIYKVIFDFDLVDVDCADETYRVEAYFDPNLSWASVNRMDESFVDLELRYVNMQYKVTEIHAQKLRNFLYPIENLCDYGYVNIDFVINGYKEDAAKMTKQMHAEIIEDFNQFPRWEEKLNKLLEEKRAKYREMVNAG